jgi:opacity protein-like surface antigen
MWAQLISFGVKGGIPATDAFNAARTGNFRYTSDTKRYLVGGAFELRFPLGLGIEFDALYKRLNYEVVQSTAALCPTCGDATFSTSANSWEFPLLFKLRAPTPGLRPYAVAGPSFRHLSGLGQFIVDPFGTRRETDRPSELQNRFSSGFAVGAGLETGNRFRVAPEMRYTRWGWENFQSAAVPDFRNNPNQLDFLVGVHF